MKKITYGIQRQFSCKKQDTLIPDHHETPITQLTRWSRDKHVSIDSLSTPFLLNPFVTLRDNYFLLHHVFSTWELKALLNVLCTGFHLQKLTVSLETERCISKIKNTTNDSPLPPAFSEWTWRCRKTGSVTEHTR